MSDATPLILTASDVYRLLTPDACRGAVERAFRLLAEGRVPPAKAVGFEAPGGSFHAKVALYDDGRPVFVAKVNGNFPGNPAANGLPTIQGVLVLFDATNGRPLAIMDSGSITALRTAAASAVAADHLSPSDASILAIIGCGLQGQAHVDAIRAIRPIQQIRLYDVNPTRAQALAARHPNAKVTPSIREATHGAHIIATCTPATDFILDLDDITPGTFIAAVGTDNPHKREIHPRLMAAARVVVDDLDQCARAGDLHHAIAAGAMGESAVHAPLASVVADSKPMPAESMPIVFDSTGIALEDAAAACVAHGCATTTT